MGNSDNRKRGVNSRQNEKNREALIAVLTVCLIGVLVTVVIIAAVDLYRKHTYTAEIDPSEYKIIKIEKVRQRLILRRRKPWIQIRSML